MVKGAIKVFAAIPGSTSLGPILREFGKKKPGIVTAFADSLLPMCDQLLGEDSSLEVVSFAEIVRNYVVLCGEEALPLAQSGQARAAISYACSQLPDESPFYRSARFEGFHEAVGNTLDELRHWGIDASCMADLAERTGGRLSEKLRSLAELDGTVTEVLKLLGRQRHSDQLALSLESTLELEGDMNRLLVFIGSEEDPLRVEWLRWIAAQGVEVTVVVDRHATGAAIFAGAKQCVSLLGVQPIEMGDGNRLARNLFTGSDQGGGKIEVSIVSAADPLAEVEWALRGCIEDDKVGRSAIYARDLQSYAPLIEAAAKRFGVPIRMARRVPLLTNSFARLSLIALKFCASYDVRTLAPILRSSYLRLPGPTQRGLDQVLRDCYAKRGEQWPELETWALEHSEGNEWLVSMLEWRRKAVAGGLRLSEWYPLVREFNREQKFPWVALQNKGGLMDERDRRALNQMERLLANHISVDDAVRPASIGLGEFVALCERLWSEGDVSIPTGESGVCVTTDTNLIGDVEQLFVLGMLEGVFPRRRSEDPILTDAERSEITTLHGDGMRLPNSLTKAEAERDTFYRVCAAAQKEIVFSYPVADDDKDNIPAFYLSEVERAVYRAEQVRDGVVQVEQKVERVNYPRPELAPAIGALSTDADIKMRNAIDGPREGALPLEIVSESVRQAIRPPEGAAFDPHVLRDALRCPFQYLSRHVLHLRVKRQQARWGSLRKLPLATQLLSKQDMADAEQAMRGALEAELDQLYAEVPEWEMRLLRAGGQRLIRDWLHRESRSREEWTKEPGSVRPNVSFGSPGVRDVMPGNVKLEGLIPAVSKLENYNVVHLYGSAVSDPKNMSDIDKLYLGLHLMAVHEPGREGAIEVESMSGKRALMVLARGASRPLASSVADGLHVVDLATEDNVADSKRKFYDAVKAALQDAVQRILQARVDATKGDHCDWCDYGELCRRSRGFGEADSPFGEDAEFDDV